MPAHQMTVTSIPLSRDIGMSTWIGIKTTGTLYLRWHGEYSEECRGVQPGDRILVVTGNGRPTAKRMIPPRDLRIRAFWAKGFGRNLRFLDYDEFCKYGDSLVRRRNWMDTSYGRVSEHAGIIWKQIWEANVWAPGAWWMEKTTTIEEIEGLFKRRNYDENCREHV